MPGVEPPPRPELPPPAGESARATEVHVLDYLRVLSKRRWTAGTAFGIVVVMALIYTFTTPRIYEARAQLLLEVDKPNVVDFKEVIDQDRSTIEYYQTQYRILQSRALAAKTLDSLQLWSHPEFGGERWTLRRAATRGWTAMVEAVRRPFVTPQSPVAPQRAAAERSGPASGLTAEQSRTIDGFLTHLTIVPVRNSRLVEVKFQSLDPALAARVINALTRVYIEQNLDFRLLASQEASHWLTERLAEQRKQVEQTELALQRYREQNDAVSLDERQNIVVQKLADLNAAVTRAKTQRIEKEALYNQLRSVEAKGSALDSFPGILSNTFIQQLKGELADLQRQHAQLSQRYGDRHPEMIRLQSAIQTAEARIHGEIAKAVQAVRNEFLAAQAQERSLVAALESQKTEALELNRKAIEYGALQRDATSNRGVFESLLQRVKETGVSGALRTTSIRVVDAAEVPRSPVWPKIRFNLLLALFGGGVLGIGLAFFFEYLDNRIRTPDEIKAHLGVPFLGLVPEVSPKVIKERALVSDGVPPGFAEAFRAIRTNLLFSATEAGPRSLLVTSTGTSEGKTMVAVNLALSLAQSGERVLLLDADMRRPRVHEIFHQAQEPGLSNVLVGNARPSAAVRQSPTTDLWILPAGLPPPNPAELLVSQRFSEFLKSLGEYFDWVVIDSPPALAVTDAAILAHTATDLVLVVGAEMTGRQAAQAAVEQLGTAKARLLGAILNRVDLERNPYYYSRYYRREYSAYYLGS